MNDDERQFEDFVCGIKFDDTPDPGHREKLEQELVLAMAKLSQRKEAPLRSFRAIAKGPITRFVVAAAIIIAVIIGLHHYTGSIDMATPAFADVVENMLSQKWVYMFEEDRKKGQITWEYWYSPGEGKIYASDRTHKGAAGLVDINARELHEYQDDTITITKPYDFDDMTGWLGQRMPMLSDLLTRYQREGAEIVQKEALYNSKPALLYEIEITLPDGDAVRTDKFTWLVDSKTHLPIICEHTHLYGRDYNGTYKESAITSERYAFDYSDSGPTDIYDLGVPVDANIVDERPLPEIQQLIDNINQAKETKYNSFAAVIMKREMPNRLVIRDGRRICDESYELRINYSDWEPKKEQYLQAMGQTFDSIYQWLGQTDIMLRQVITVVDEQFSYRTDDWDIEDNEPVKMGRRSGNNDEFSFYCWRSMPEGQIVTTPFSAEHNLICTRSDGRHYYYDPAKDYMCVRYETKEGRVHFEILEFAQTPAGMLYPSKIREGYYSQKTGTNELIPGSELVYIYARDLNDQLRAKLAPHSLPNYVDHRKLTRQMKLQQGRQEQEEPVEYTGFTPLHMAIYRQETERVKKYLEKGAEVEPVYDSGATPMELAVASGNLEMVKLLYEYGADFVSNDGEHRDALGLAAKEGFYEIAQFMLAIGSDVDSIYKHHSRPLHYAAANGDLAMTRLLLAHGAEVDLRGESGRTPLYNAIDYLAAKLYYPKPTEQTIVQRFKGVIMLLIENGADINARNTSKKTAMSRAISIFVNDRRSAEQQIEFLRFLLACGADPDSNAKLRHNSCFYRAAEKRRYDIVEVLLEGGADPWLVVDHEHWPARHNLLYFARRRNDNELFDLLHPYMKQRYEQTNAEVLEVAGLVLQASLKDDTAAINALCTDHPDYSRPWKVWPKEIRKFYEGHEDLFDRIVHGWFTLDGLAEVYVPLPEGMVEKSILLGFIQCPDGRWKCIYYKKLKYMPEDEKTNKASYFTNDSHNLDEFRNYMYDQASMPQRITTRGTGSSTRYGKLRSKLILSVQDNALRIDFDDKNWRKRYVLLTPDYVKKYRGNELTVYSKEYIYKQKDYPQRLIFRPLTMIVENGYTKHVFTVSDGQVMLTDGELKTKAGRFVFDLTTYQVDSSK